MKSAPKARSFAAIGASHAALSGHCTAQNPPVGPPGHLRTAPQLREQEDLTHHALIGTRGSRSGSTKGCYALKSKKDPTGTIRCPPLATPLASVDDLDVDPRTSARLALP